MTTHKSARKSIATSTTAADTTSFHATLLRASILLALAIASFTWLFDPSSRFFLALPVVLFAPGFLLERALREPMKLTLFLRPALWLGLSLSIITLVYEWITALGLSLTLPALSVFTVGLVAGVAVCLWRDTRQLSAFPQSWWMSYAWWLALLGVFVFALWTRFYEIRDLAFPAWVDSVHHALLIRVAAERGQAPLSLQPYLPIDHVPYHWGYHVLVASILRLSSTELAQAMLWSGQVLNALHVLTVAALATFLWRRPVGGVAAGIVVGLLSIFPAYYVSWGRYTQLTGLLILPPLMCAWLTLLRSPSRRLTALIALLLAGLSMIHFVVLIMALAFMAISAAIWAHDKAPFERITSGSHAIAGGLIALILAAPWLWSLVSRRFTPQIGGSPALTGDSADYYKLDPGLLWAGFNRWLIAFALLAALWLLRRHRMRATEQLVWLGALAVLANPWLALYVLPALGASIVLYSIEHRRPFVGIGGIVLLCINPWFISLPYIGIFTNEVVVISLFLPLAVLLGGAVELLWNIDSACLTRAFPSIKYRVIVRSIICGAGIVLAVWGGWHLRNVVNPSTVLATRADAAAIEWVEANTPPDAHFLINSAPWLVTGRGVDGGWGLLPLTGRSTSIPPVLYEFGPPDYVAAVRANTRLTSHFEPGQEQQIYDLIARDRISYIYLGVNTKPLRPETFPASAGFTKVYERDGVTIFAVANR